MPFLEGAIGFHLLSDDNFGDKDLGAQFAFGDHIAAGIRFGDRHAHELSLKLQHFSNAGLRDENPGVNFGMVRYGYHF
jgi:hypothetical protein